MKDQTGKKQDQIGILKLRSTITTIKFKCRHLGSTVERRGHMEKSLKIQMEW